MAIIMSSKFLHPVYVFLQVRQSVYHTLTLKGAFDQRLTLDQSVQVQALVMNILLYSWTRQFTLSVPLSTPVYKWVPANLMVGISL